MNKKDEPILLAILYILAIGCFAYGMHYGIKSGAKEAEKVPERKTWTYFYTYTKADGKHKTIHEPKLYTYEECKSELKNSNITNAYGCAENCKMPSDGEDYYEMDCSKYCTKIDDRIACSDSRDIMTVR